MIQDKGKNIERKIGNISKLKNRVFKYLKKSLKILKIRYMKIISSTRFSKDINNEKKSLASKNKGLNINVKIFKGHGNSIKLIA